MLTEIPPGRGRGTYTRVQFGTYEDHPWWSAIICCPECGELLNLSMHTIAKDGQVSPSVGHPKNVSCPWHTSPRLLDWPADAPAPLPYQKYKCGRCEAQSRNIGQWGVGWGYSLLCAACIATLKDQPK